MSHSTPKTRSIGLKTDRGHRLSPAIMLAHEAGHGADYLRNPTGYQQNRAIEMPKFDTYAEYLNIRFNETNAAIKTGEIPVGEHTRDGHGDTSFRTQSPISNEPYKK